jgi:hypothetical protein
MHPNEIVLRTQMRMIVTIICEYPEQTLWSLIAVMKSENKNRSYRGIEILGKLKVLPVTTLLIIGYKSSNARRDCKNWKSDTPISRRPLEALQLRNYRTTSDRKSHNRTRISCAYSLAMFVGCSTSVKSNGHSAVDYQPKRKET